MTFPCQNIFADYFGYEIRASIAWYDGSSLARATIKRCLLPQLRLAQRLRPMAQRTNSTEPSAVLWWPAFCRYA